MNDVRRCGVLLHPTSLPGRFGIGGFGENARRFLDFLSEAGQTVWQVLPFHPPAEHNSPYKSLSTFAGSSLLIDPEVLVADDLLDAADLEGVPVITEGKADFPAAEALRKGWLRKAFSRRSKLDSKGQDKFYEKNRHWLDDFALFMVLREQLGEESWRKWPKELRAREKPALKDCRGRWSREIEEQIFQQYVFFKQWKNIKDYAAEKGILIFGDMPIFVSLEGADVWAHPELFHLDSEGNPTVVAGVPPDYFSKTGQMWGTALYRWDRHRDSGFHWWIERIRCSLEIVDILRIDHFRGLVAFWAIPAGAENASAGEWRPGPGKEFLRAVKDKLGDLPLIAEDLGIIDSDVVELRDGFAFPGMNVLQFAFDLDATNPHLPHNHKPDNVVYTGTHDNDTTRSWYDSAPRKIKQSVRAYLGHSVRDIVWSMIRLAYASVAQIAVIPMQDLLELGGEARMNNPGHEEGNWFWRLSKGMLGETPADALKSLAVLYGRTPKG